MTRLQPHQIAQAVPRLADGVSVQPGNAGCLRLERPLPPRRGLQAVLAWIVRRPTQVQVELDQIGSDVVRGFDGRNLETLAGELASRHRLTRREAEASLTVFVEQLLRRRLLHLDGLYEGARS